MKQSLIPVFMAVLLTVDGACAGSAKEKGNPLSIIALPDSRDRTAIQQYVKLYLPYGIIINNGDTNGIPRYYLFCRDKRTISKTDDVDTFLAQLEKLPDGSTIDRVSKCTVGFYTSYGTNIDEAYKSISALMKRKRFKLVSTSEDDERHVFFCYCETGFIILDTVRASEQRSTGKVQKKVPEE